jgi:hypothetical protein
MNIRLFMWDEWVRNLVPFVVRYETYKFRALLRNATPVEAR